MEHTFCGGMNQQSLHTVMVNLLFIVGEFSEGKLLIHVTSVNPVGQQEALWSWANWFLLAIYFWRDLIGHISCACIFCPTEVTHEVSSFFVP